MTRFFLERAMSPRLRVESPIIVAWCSSLTWWVHSHVMAVDYAGVELQVALGVQLTTATGSGGVLCTVQITTGMLGGLLTFRPLERALTARSRGEDRQVPDAVAGAGFGCRGGREQALGCLAWILAVSRRCSPPDVLYHALSR